MERLSQFAGGFAYKIERLVTMPGRVKPTGLHTKAP